MNKPLKKRQPRPYHDKIDLSAAPFSPWNNSYSYYGGFIQGRERNEWFIEDPPFVKNVKGFDIGLIALLKRTYTENVMRGANDVFYHYFACGELIDKIRRDFRDSIVGAWKTARALVPDFPSYTIIDMNNVLDPLEDNRAKYYSPLDYIEIKPSHLKRSAIEVCMRGSTPKGSTRIKVDMQYATSGEVVGCDCEIQRKSRCYALRMRNNKKGPFIKRIEEKLASEAIWIPLFNATGYDDYAKKLKHRGLSQLIEVADSPNKEHSRKSNPKQKKKSKIHKWTPEEDEYIKLHSDSTASELAKHFKVTPKAIERRRAHIRKMPSS